MLPTFETGDYLLVERFKANFNKIARYDVVVFDIPNTQYAQKHNYHTCYISWNGTCYWLSKRYLVKRVIGLPGERVSIINGATTIYNKEHPDGMLLVDNYVAYPSAMESEVTLKDGEYYVMGDNRANSADSRFFGPVSIDNVIGTPFVRLLPFSNIDVAPGKLTQIDSN
jgi:signal peptidase I